MHLKAIVHEDYTNYRLPAMLLGVCYCDFKCCREDRNSYCQNSPVFMMPTFEMSDEEIVRAYLDNPLTHAVVIAGLEPFYQQTEEVLSFAETFRKATPDDIVIYTGYYPDEVREPLERLRPLGNIYLKFGRFRAGDSPHLDAVLGVELANREQYGMRLC